MKQRIGKEVRRQRKVLKQRMLLEVECDEIEDGKGSEISMKGFEIQRVLL